MAIHTVRRAFSSISQESTLQFARDMLQIHVIFHLVRIAVSIALLPLDNTILLASYAAGYVPGDISQSSSHERRRQRILRDENFRPRTVLVTGVNTPHGLAVARGWYYAGHRVVGANITEGAIAPGEGMSKTLAAFYHVPKSKYSARLLDIIQKEKVEIWIPCANEASALDDAAAKQVIESRTHCKCITLDASLAEIFSNQDTFNQYLVEKRLPVVEKHQVLSRDAIHKILHRSPSKIYQMRRPTPTPGDDKVVVLPKRTLSLTYSEVSEIQISKERPWILQQQTRLGQFVAEVMVICGHVKAIKIYPGDRQSDWGHSRLDKGLARAAHALTERFALQGGPRLTGHLRLQLTVDEEFNDNFLRYAIHIEGCEQGAAAVKFLLENKPDSMVAEYLEVLTPHINGVNGEAPAIDIASIDMEISTPPPETFSLCRMARNCDVRRVLPALYPAIEQIDRSIHEGSRLLLFWKNWRFSAIDPLPWWWHTHIYQPLKEIEMIMNTNNGKQA
ncbi:uncharacterized protein BO97DRAFT_404321 [Aspergillus homomorphus CBS 101889]|uniref:ATP-grasp domain-containing protein n=1 Tax=Aspergillus homomorphus (strain CBS 101889) TaxID=1450537 RepID=A0A395I3U9_ASPHC|nr:hypothetical protein BO97DRAFT_404321 [Aspergillus homomorphus CBS 101889]RAL14406.1 hypothetical protein BO97DRAFT_404321 [Aspergillus homomorphus CBS 101889]